MQFEIIAMDHACTVVVTQGHGPAGQKESAEPVCGVSPALGEDKDPCNRLPLLCGQRLTTPFDRFNSPGVGYPMPKSQQQTSIFFLNKHSVSVLETGYFLSLLNFLKFRSNPQLTSLGFPSPCSYLSPPSCLDLKGLISIGFREVALNFLKGDNNLLSTSFKVVVHCFKLQMVSN